MYEIIKLNCYLKLFENYIKYDNASARFAYLKSAEKSQFILNKVL